MSEHNHQKFVFDILRLNEQAFPFLKYVHAIPNGGHRHPAVAGKLKAEGVKRGISDICLPFPNTPMHPESPEYVGAYIEMKDGKKKPTKEQQEFLDFVKTQGFAGIVATDCEMALDFIEYYAQIKLRGRK